jgi:HAD superfamily hydrolase (TIGR01549 family)
VTGFDARRGQAIEEAIEQELCYANPFMKAVYDELLRRGKRIVITSDMYLGKSVLESILEGCGYTGYERFFLSNVYHKSKSDGRLYDVVREYVGRDCDIIHVGDNLHSDIKMAKRAHFATLHYPNVNTDTLMFRPYDMSPIVGGAYRGIVNNRLYNGASLEGDSMEYEYGFVYGGLFAMGYCAHIHEYVEAHDIDKVLFLSRDGDILKQVYERMYPADAISGKTAYAYWSRKAAMVLMFDLDRNDFYRRFLYHKVNQGYKLSEILHSMELDSIADEIEGFHIGDTPADLIHEEGRAITLHLSDELSAKNVHVLREALDRLAMRIREAYRDRDAAAKQYYMSILRDARSAVAVDIGWAGSGAIALRRLCREHWGINCDLRGLIAGTNTVYNAEPYQTETFLQSGLMDAYLYSMSHNRDLMKKHNPNLDYNIYWELLLSSPTQQFVGFKLNAAGEVEYDFGKYDANPDGIRDVQTGILDFVEDYMEHFGNPVTGDFPEMYKVSGRDAYAPMIVASSHHERYLKTIERRFALEMNVV